MRTKTLLIAAAALAVGVATSMAQTTYSQNVVGYVNTTIAANGYFMVGNQLVNGSDANATNNNVNACYGAGLVSSPAANGTADPALSSNTVLYAYNGGYFTYYYFNAADAATWGSLTPGPGFFDEGGNAAPVTLNQGQGAFLYNHFGAPITATITGNVLQGTNALPSIAAGYQILSLPVPISTNAVVAGYGLPTTMTSQPIDPPSAYNNDIMYLYNGGYFTYYYFNASDAVTWGASGPGPGFFDLGGNPAPNPLVNQGFFIFHHGATIPWSVTFMVQ